MVLFRLIWISDFGDFNCVWRGLGFFFREGFLVFGYKCYGEVIGFNLY